MSPKVVAQVFAISHISTVIFIITMTYIVRFYQSTEHGVKNK